jgi:uncharacterized protein
MEQTNQQHGCGGGACRSVGYNHRGVLTIVFILLGAFLLALTIKTAREISYVGRGAPPTNVINVSGSGEVVALPDTAEFTFSVIEEGDTAVAVRDAANKKMSDAMAVLKEKGVEDKDVKTTAYDLQPKYEWQPVTCVRFPCDRTQVQKGFTLTQHVKVKVRALDTAGDVLAAVTGKGVQAVSGLTFTVADEDASKAEARKVAIEEAQAKAKELAADLGVTLVRVVGFSEDSAYPTPFYGERAMSVDADVAAGSAMKLSANVPAGENQVVSNVLITYEVQ